MALAWTIILTLFAAYLGYVVFSWILCTFSGQRHPPLNENLEDLW